MKSKMVLTLLAASAVLMSSCGVSRVASVYTNIKSPVTATTAPSYRVGYSSSRNILGIAAWGDASINAAKRDGNITTVSSVDEKIFSILGVYTSCTTIVHGQ